MAPTMNRVTGCNFTTRILCAALALGIIALFGVALPRIRAAQRALDAVSVNNNDIGGVVTSSKGPEVGVWVIAETSDLPTRYRKMVVTDDAGRYMLPDLPKANYKVWVRGYGLVDSEKVDAAPGRTLALKAVVAPDAVAAAQYYPGDYWYSLLKIPPKSAFPLKTRASGANGKDAEITQAEYLFQLKRGCEVCHQMGNKATRDLEASLGTFDSPALAWERRLMSGQVGPEMTAALNEFGHDRGLAMFADWTSRIAAGEVPPAPPRPQGVERNVVITMWDFDTDRSFIHDVVSTDQRNPTVNPYGPIYGTEFSAGAITVLDPIKNTKSMIRIPLEKESDRKLLKPWSAAAVAAPSPYWGNEIVWDDPVTPAAPHIDNKGRLWFHTQTRADLPAFCKEGSGNPFTKNFPAPAGSVAKGAGVYDPKTGKFELVDTCLSSGHMAFANDEDQTLYFGNAGVNGIGAIGWINTRVWDETHDAEKSQGWCPAILDYNGDGRTGAYTKLNEPADPKLDRVAAEATGGYGIAVNPVDNSVWYAGGH